MANYNFKKDLYVAKNTEKEVGTILESNCNAEIIAYENSSKYDILAKIQDKEVTFEVKEDFMCEITGNVGLEFECRGKPSGIAISEADYYIYKLHTKNGIEYVIHKTSILKQMVEDGLYFRVVNGGDKGSNTMNYLFKHDAFVETGKRLTVSGCH